MGRILLLIFGLLCLCLIIFCCIGIMIYAFLLNSPDGALHTPSAPSAGSPATVTPQFQVTAEVPTVVVTPQVQVPAATCPDVMTSVLKAGEGDSYGPGSDYSDNPTDQTLVIYSVDGNQISNPYYSSVPNKLRSMQLDTQSQQAAWDLFTELIPLDDRQMVSKYMVFTDGPSNILAAVEQAPDDPNKWAVELDSADLADKKILVFTLIHEYGHLLTLNASQVPPNMAVFNNPNDDNLYEREVAACTTYFPGEGCSLSDSYINTFYDRFWQQIVKEWQPIDDLSYQDDQSEYYDQLYAFYQKHQDQFVDDYAATDPSEDMAETFAYFVLSPKPKGNTIYEQKMLFYYNYPELVQIREQILQGLCQIKP